MGNVIPAVTPLKWNDNVLHYEYIACPLWTEDPGLLSLGSQTGWRGETFLPRAHNWLLEVSCFWQRLQIQILPWACQLMQVGEAGRGKEAEPGGDCGKLRPPSLWSRAGLNSDSQSYHTLPVVLLERGPSIDRFP